jgi:hypothetical protein
MFLKRDPGPCPVDDAPHTTCTSSDYDPSVTIVQLPNRDGVHPPALVQEVRMPFVLSQAQQQPTQPPEASTSFTTKTYTRSVHGRPRTRPNRR